MKNEKYFLIGFVITAALFFAGWSSIEHYQINREKNKRILLEAIPVDPRDLISGNYFILNYKVNNLKSFDNYQDIVLKNDDKVYAVLKKNEDYFVPYKVFLYKPKITVKNFVVIKGNIKYDRIDYGIEKFFINEKQKEPTRDDKVEVSISIDKSLKVRIKKVFVNGQEIK